MKYKKDNENILQKKQNREKNKDDEMNRRKKIKRNRRRKRKICIPKQTGSLYAYVMITDKGKIEKIKFVENKM